MRIEIYAPSYANLAGRPTITASPPNIGYLHQFLIDTPQANSIARVALMRCGSCTHGFNPDQRYVGVSFSVVDGNTLRIDAPPDGNVAPPVRRQHRPIHLDVELPQLLDLRVGDLGVL